MNRFFIIAIPSEKDLKILNKIRLYFNQNGFREEISNNVNDAHITLASGTYKDEAHIQEIKEVFQKDLKAKSPFSVSLDHVTNVHKPANNEEDFEHNWIALRFHNDQLQELSAFCEKILSNLKISTTREYVEFVHNSDPDSKNEAIVGDHMNMCIWCKPEKAEEAYTKCAQEAPRTMTISKVGFRYTDENKKVKHAWEIEL